jgi:A118 family predicted phage portal protein
MFQKLLAWIREVLNKMLSTSTVKSAIGVDVAISPQMASALQEWSAMYSNQADWLSDRVTSLNLSASIAGEIARAVTIEMDVEITGSARAKYLDEQFDKVTDAMRERVEQGAAKGGLMMKPYINGKNIAVDYVQADQFYPISFDSNGKITACVFSDQRTVGDKFYTKLEFHNLTSSGYVIRNMAYRSTARDTLGQQVELAAMAEWADLQPEATITGIDKPLFAYFRYPLANNIDSTSPLGVSCYARAVELIEQADKQWSDLLWEFESGERALYVDSQAFGHDKTGKPILPNKRLYRTLNSSTGVGGEEMFNDWTPTLREANYINGLNAILRKIEFACGLAYGTLSDPQTIDKTATELKISQQRSYATITDTQKALEDALEQLLYAMDVWTTLGNLAPAGMYSTVYDFDDSVIVDKAAQFVQDLGLVASQLMSKLEFRMRNFGEDEATAQEKLDLISNEQQASQNSFAGALLNAERNTKTQQMPAGINNQR